MIFCGEGNSFISLQGLEMSNQLYAALLGVLLGGALSFFSTLGIQILQEGRITKNKRLLFSQAISDSLEKDILLYDIIENDWKKTGLVWFEYTTEIKEYRQIYEKHIDIVLIFKNNLRKAIFEYYSKTKWLISLLEADERRKLDLSNKLFSLTKDIMNLKNISEEEAKKAALIELKSEDEEFNRTNINIKSNLDKLISMKQDAKKIITELLLIK